MSNTTLMDYPVYFDNTKILWALKWDEDSDVVENVSESEAGTDIVNVVRMDKLTISCKYKCSDVWARTFKEFSLQDSIEVKRFNVLTGGYETRTMRMRNFSISMDKKSEKVRGSHGVWEVTFKLEEF